MKSRWMRRWWTSTTVWRGKEGEYMKFIGKLLKTVVLTALALFVSTFIIYMFNLENKLIYKVIYPFLQKHYNSQRRDRRI